MSQKELVCQGATCKCQFGNAPDKLKVLTQTKQYINDAEGKEKLMATHVDIGMTFEKNTFGKCKLQPTSSGYLPCIPALTEWKGYYDKITIEQNGGKALLEDSKGVCTIAGSPCLEITQTGQIAEPTPQNMENGDPELLAQINPFFDASELKLEGKIEN